MKINLNDLSKDELIKLIIEAYEKIEELEDMIEQKFWESYGEDL